MTEKTGIIKPFAPATGSEVKFVETSENLPAETTKFKHFNVYMPAVVYTELKGYTQQSSIDSNMSRLIVRLIVEFLETKGITIK